MLYTDIREAFDRVNHSILLLEMSETSVQPSLLKYISSYSRNCDSLANESESRSTTRVSQGAGPKWCRV